MDYKGLLDYSLNQMKEAGADKAQVVLTKSEKQELNTESNSVKLMRSNDAVTMDLKFIKDMKQGTTSISKADKKSIDEAVEKLKILAGSAPVDEANDIAPGTEGKFELGVRTPDLNGLYSQLFDFNESMKANFSNISGDAVYSYDSADKFIANTNGLYLEESKGNYNFSILYAAKEGEKITSFNYTTNATVDFNKPLMKTAMLEERLDQTVEELDAQPFDGKFVGDVIVTPQCLSEFLFYISMIALTDGPLVQGTSVLKDRIGEKIAADFINWHSEPRNPELAGGYAVTGDGFEAEDLTIIENGVLKNLLLSQYGANKTGRVRSKNYGNAFVMDAGDQSLDNLIANVDRGILLSRFSGGRPSADGSFAGVAKNSFYIENGKIMYPISETMVSGNLFDLLKDAKAVSKRRINYGSSILPWLHSTGCTVSGK